MTPRDAPPTGERRRKPLVARRGSDVASRTKVPEKPTPTRKTPPLPPPPKPPPGLSDADGTWMSPRQAADAAGVSMAAIRRWRKAGTIADRPAPDAPGRIEVFLAADRHKPAAARSSATGSPPDGSGARSVPHSELGVLVPLEIHQRSLAELILRLTDTTERAVRAETELQFLRKEIATLKRRK